MKATKSNAEVSQDDALKMAAMLGQMGAEGLRLANLLYSAVDDAQEYDAPKQVPTAFQDEVTGEWVPLAVWKLTHRPAWETR